MTQYWNKEIECMEREDLEKLQLERLQKMVKYIYENVEFYRGKIDEAGLKPEDIKTLKDLEKFPFTYKQDLRDNYPNGLLACPQSEINRIHASSGTTGKATVVMYTKKDLDIWSEMVARSFTSVGASKGDIVQVSYGYGLFTGGLGLHYGAEKIGASVVPTSSGNTSRQITLMNDLGSTVLCCTPSYGLYLGETMADMNVKPGTTKLKYGVFGAEPWTEAMRDELERSLGIKAYNIYGLSEIFGPGVAMECEAKNGMHIWEDNFIVEIINPETGEVLPDGELGELVITTITKEGMPLLRYRTRDLTRLIREKCSCGRTMVRMDRIFGRSDDMLIIRGVNVFPSQIESALLDLGLSPFYHLIVDRVGNMDSLEVQVEVSEDLLTAEIRGLEEMRSKIKHKIDSLIGISAKVTLVEPKTLERFEGKAKRVTDKRVLQK